MRNCMNILDEKLLKMKCKCSSFRKGDGAFMMIMGAAIGTLILIGFYMIAKDGVESWGTAFEALVSE